MPRPLRERRVPETVLLQKTRRAAEHGPVKGALPSEALSSEAGRDVAGPRFVRAATRVALGVQVRAVVVRFVVTVLAVVAAVGAAASVPHRHRAARPGAGPRAGREEPVLRPGAWTTSRGPVAVGARRRLRSRPRPRCSLVGISKPEVAALADHPVPGAGPVVGAAKLGGVTGSILSFLACY